MGSGGRDIDLVASPKCGFFTVVDPTLITWAPMKGAVVGGRYRLVRLLGSGGMGSVWLAEHMSLKNEVAIKLIDSELGKLEQPRARFIREAQLAARIKSAHVVQIYDHGMSEEGQPFIAMEYLVGETLRDRLTSRGRLTPAETARILSHVTRALVRAQEAGLVHRDLKPENIFIAKEGDDEVVKVLDFGVAKAADMLSDSSIDPTRTGALLGTPFYMSPEQAQGLKTVDYRTDLWAMGVVVFECLTGSLPFSAEALGPLIGKIVVGPIPVPSRVAPDVNLGLNVDAWMARALHRDPAQRFASAKEMSEGFMIASGNTASLSRSDPPARSFTLPPPVDVNPLGLTVPMGPPAFDTLTATSAIAPPSARPAGSRVAWLIVILITVAGATVAGLLLLRR